MVIYLTHNLIGRVAGYEIKVYLVDFKNSNESLFNIFSSFNPAKRKITHFGNRKLTFAPKRNVKVSMLA